MSVHTPTPWEVGDLDRNGQRTVLSKRQEVCTCWHHGVVSIEREMEANAEFIVRACNSHDKLLLALVSLEALVVACSAHSLACQSRRIDARRRDADEYGQLPCNCTQALALANGRVAIKKARGK